MQLAQSIYVTTDYNFNDQGRALLVNHCYGGLIWDEGELQLYGERLVARKVYMNSANIKEKRVYTGCSCSI